MDTSYSHKVIKGSFWILSLRVTNRALGLVRTIVLARLLLPEHFGIVGIAAITISTLETFSQPGLGTALIQKKGVIEEYLDTAWTVSIIRSLIIFTVLYISAPYVAGFFNMPQANIVIRVFGISVVIAGCRNIGVVYFQKEMDFRRQYIYQFSITLGNIAVAIPAAFILRSVWALVLGGIAGSVVRLILSYVLHPFRPSFRFQKQQFDEMFGFGKWVLGSSILVFLITQGDDIFIGKMFGAAALGLYQMAYMISNLPTTETAAVISHVTFPAYSAIQDDIARFAEAYLKVLQVIAFIAVPMAGGIFVFASDIIRLLLTEKWMATVPIVKVLVWAGLLNTFMLACVPVFSGMGKPRTNTKWQFIGFVILALLIYPLSISLGVVGVSFAVLASNVVTSVGYIFEVHKMLRYDLIRFTRTLLFPSIGMLLFILAVSRLKDFMAFDPIVSLMVLLVSAAIVYLMSIWFFDKAFSYNMGKIIKETIASLKATLH